MNKPRLLTNLEFNELYEVSHGALTRTKLRIFMITGLSAILVIIYPIWIILTFYLATLVTEYGNYIFQKKVLRAHHKNLRLDINFREKFFYFSWAESLSIVGLFVALCHTEGPQTHFIPYLIVLCTAIYTATATFQNAVLMFGHLALYNVVLLYASARDVLNTYPETDSAIWGQFLISLLIIYFLIDSYKFFYQIYQERRAKSEEVEEARIQAEKLMHQKSDLISAIGHELRTPLNGILGFSQIVKNTKLTKKQHEYVNLIEESGKDLNLLLSNILDSETLDQGRLQICVVESDVKALLERTLKIFEVSAHDKGIFLKLDIPSDFPNKIFIDEIRLRQCVSNLLSNAIRYTDTGGVTVSASVSEDDKSILYISIKDTGIGIPEDQTEKVFQKFFQGNNHPSVPKGTGLGLWLVKSVAKAINGDLLLVSSSSLGSVFRLEFELPSNLRDAPLTDAGLANLRILHVEDTETNLILVRLFLEDQGAIVSETKTVNGAFELLQKQDFDMVLCDIQLPDMDGHNVLKFLRNLQNKNAHIPVVAITALPEKVIDSKEEYRFAAILQKPIDQRILVSTLSRLSNINT